MIDPTGLSGDFFDDYDYSFDDNGNATVIDNETGLAADDYDESDDYEAHERDVEWLQPYLDEVEERLQRISENENLKKGIPPQNEAWDTLFFDTNREVPRTAEGIYAYQKIEISGDKINYILSGYYVSDYVNKITGMQERREGNLTIEMGTPNLILDIYNMGEDGRIDVTTFEVENVNDIGIDAFNRPECLDANTTSDGIIVSIDISDSFVGVKASIDPDNCNLPDIGVAR